MATSDPSTIKVVQDAEIDGYVLYIDGGRRATMYNERDKLSIEILTAGTFPINEMVVLLQGLAKLVEIGSSLDKGKTDVGQYLHNLTDEEIAMATKAKAKKAKKTADKAAKKSGAPKAPRESASSMFCDLIMAGNLTDDKIFEKVQAKFSLSDDKRKYVAWYRNKLTKDGKKPPAAKE